VPLRVTVTLVASAPSIVEYVAVANENTDRSLSTIVTAVVPWSPTMLPPVGLLSVTRNVLFGLSTRLLATGTVKLRVVTPCVNVSAPLVAV